MPVVPPTVSAARPEAMNRTLDVAGHPVAAPGTHPMVVLPDPKPVADINTAFVSMPNTGSGQRYGFLRETSALPVLTDDPVESGGEDTPGAPSRRDVREPDRRRPPIWLIAIAGVAALLALKGAVSASQPPPPSTALAPQVTASVDVQAPVQAPAPTFAPAVSPRATSVVVKATRSLVKYATSQASSSTQAGASKSATHQPSTSAAQVALTCTGGFSLVTEWQGGYQGSVAVTNTSQADLKNWTIDFVVPEGSTVAQLWGGSYSQNGTQIHVTAPNYQTGLSAGASVSVGYNVMEDRGRRGSRPGAWSIALSGTGCS
jgi:hypothetical protein